MYSSSIENCEIAFISEEFYKDLNDMIAKMSRFQFNKYFVSKFGKTIEEAE